MAQRAGGDKRGSSADRRRSKQNLLCRHGNGETAPCAWCDTQLTIAELTRDRIVAGASYALNNLIPACLPCNQRRGDKPFVVFLAQCDAPDTALRSLETAKAR